MKKEKNIISELQRMREMMGVKPMNRIAERYVMESVNRRVRLITEASGGGDDLGERAIKALFGDDVFAKSAAESFETGAKELSQTLEKEGLTNIDNLINKIASTKQINTSDVTDEMIDDSLKLFFKNNPKIAEDVLLSSSKFVSDVLKGADFFKVLGQGNEELAENLKFVIDDVITDTKNYGIYSDELTALSKQFRDATKNSSIPGVKDIQQKLDAAALVSKKSKEGFANISTNPDAVVVKSEDLTTKSSDVTVKTSDEELTKTINELGDENLISFMNDIISKVSDEDMKLIDEVVATIPKGKENEFIQKSINAICGLKESRNFNKRLSLITEDVQQNCSNAKSIIQVFDKKGRVTIAVLKMFASITAVVIGLIAAYDLISGYWGWRKTGYEIDNPLDDTDNTEEDEVIGGGGKEYTNDLKGLDKWATDNGYTDATIDSEGAWYFLSNGNEQKASYDTDKKTWK